MKLFTKRLRSFIPSRRSIVLSFSQKEFYFKAGFIIFILILFLVNGLHEEYPDEFDNILGGWYILHGKLPNIGFFTHHGPVPYFIAAVVVFFSGQSFVRFRILYSLLLAGVLFGTYFLLKRRLGKGHVTFFPLFIAFLGIESTYYWIQMLLADNIAALSYLPVYALLLVKGFYKQKVTLFDVGVISILSTIGLYSSLTYTYIYIIVTVATLYLFIKSNSISLTRLRKPLLYSFVLLALPHAVYFIYLILTGSMFDYFFQNFTFNAKHYIYNYPRPLESARINPIRYAVIIMFQFFNNFYPLLIGVKNFEFSFPVNTTMAVGSASTFLYMLIKKRYKLALFILALLIYTNVRSNPISSKETDYQSAVYIMFSFFNIFFLLPQLYKELEVTVHSGKKILFGALLLIVGVYSFFTMFFLSLKFLQKVFPKYMGTAPLIYDRPEIAPIVNSLVDNNEYMWIGPFEFEELFYSRGKLPSKYHILVRGVGVSEKTSREMLEDFKKNMPKVIFFDQNFFYLGNKTASYSKFFLEFLDKNYETLLNYRNGNRKYTSILPIHINNKVDLEAKMFIRRDKVLEVVQKLIEKGYLRESFE